MKENAQGFFELITKPFLCLCGEKSLLEIDVHSISRGQPVNFIVRCPRSGCSSVKPCIGKQPDACIKRWNDEVEKALDAMKERIRKEKEIAS